MDEWPARTPVAAQMTDEPILLNDDYRFGAFVIPLPESVRGRVDELRQRFDPATARAAPPHITVTQPLAEEPNDIARADLGALISEFAPFEIQLGPAAAFEGTPVIFLAVEPQASILALRAAAHGTGLFRLDLPHTDDFVAHATIREWAGGEKDDEAAVIEEVDRAIPPARFTCNAIELWRPEPDGRFRPAGTIELLGS